MEVAVFGHKIRYEMTGFTLISLLIMETTRFHLLALSFIEGIGPVRTKNLIAYCGGADAVFRLPKSRLERVPGIGSIGAQKISDARSKACRFAEEEIKFCERNKTEILFFTDSSFPSLLKQSEDGPVVLYKKGEFDLNSIHGISVVGTRRATEYGKGITENFVKYFVLNNINIISGLAFGIDSIAHRTALLCGGVTTAVFGNHFGEINPSSNRKMAEQILERGTWVTEFHSRAVTEPQNFIIRNRIISGMSKATLVVESAEDGGALITARFAFDQNREVYAVPGDLNRKYSRGTHTLIRDNIAKLVTGPEEILKDLDLLTGTNSTEKNPQKYSPQLSFPLTQEENLIYENIREGPVYIDKISEKTNIPVSSLLSILLRMEFNGLVKQMPGKLFVGVRGIQQKFTSEYLD